MLGHVKIILRIMSSRGWRWDTAVRFFRRGLIIAAMMLRTKAILPNKCHGDEILVFEISFLSFEITFPPKIDY